MIAALPGLGTEMFEKLECDKPEFADHRPLCSKASNSEQTWVNFKLILIGLTFVYVLGIGVYLSRHMDPDDDSTSLPSEKS